MSLGQRRHKLSKVARLGVRRRSCTLRPSLRSMVDLRAMVRCADGMVVSCVFHTVRSTEYCRRRYACKNGVLPNGFLMSSQNGLAKLFQFQYRQENTVPGWQTKQLASVVRAMDFCYEMQVICPEDAHFSAPWFAGTRKPELAGATKGSVAGRAHIRLRGRLLMVSRERGLLGTCHAVWSTTYRVQRLKILHLTVRPLRACSIALSTRKHQVSLFFFFFSSYIEPR